LIFTVLTVSITMVFLQISTKSLKRAKYKKAGVSLERIKQMMNESNKIKVQVLEEVIVQMKLDIEAINHRIHYAENLIHELKENDDETIE
jgi:two-component SAPR family response regulator